MPSTVAVVASIAATILCWGLYGPVLHWGQDAMDHSRLRPFICVGLAYFLVAVLAPALLLTYQGERGKWTVLGTIWSVAAGAAGAIGALGVIMAFAFHGNPVYVMPLVFGGAPVVNSMLTMFWAKTYRHVNSMFLAGLIIVLIGSVTVLVFRPAIGPNTTRPAATVESDSGGQPVSGSESATAVTPSGTGLSLADLLRVIVSVLLAVTCWGCYGPMPHRGQLAMGFSRLRPLLCVGLAYFAVAVVAPALMLGVWDEPGRFTFSGTIWSLIAGAFGALGALGIILAFNFGGKPIFVMPLVFGGAPVVNTFFTIFVAGKTSEIGPWFAAGLILVVAGAVLVLVFAPRGAEAAHAGSAGQQAGQASAESAP